MGNSMFCRPPLILSLFYPDTTQLHGLSHHALLQPCLYHQGQQLAVQNCQPEKQFIAILILYILQNSQIKLKEIIIINIKL